MLITVQGCIFARRFHIGAGISWLVYISPRTLMP